MSLLKRIESGQSVKLSKLDPDHDGGVSRDLGEARLAELGQEMEELLNLLFAAGTHSLLVVLQGRDTSGKDGTIRHLLTYSNAQSTTVTPFKVPTAVELAHDFLWRVHSHTPGKGGVTIFNRSHYEDVLVVRVHDLAPKEVWAKRYDHINNFEKLLTDSNVIVLKFCLHISKDEQEQRLLEREEEPEKAWKLAVGDWKEREFWDEYTEAYEAALEKCSTSEAPWFIVPANKKWFRNLAITETIVETLKGYSPTWMKKLEAIGTVAKAELAEYRKGL